MALASRSPRRDGGRKLLVAGIIITLVVVVIDASLKSRSPTVAPRLAATAWVDRVLPIIEASTTQGQEIQQVRNTGVTSVSASSITSQVNQAATAARRSYQQLSALRAPDQLVGAAGLLEACLLVRSQAAAAMAGALTKELANGAPSGVDPQLGALTTAGQDFQVADRAYSLFAQRLPTVGVKAPASSWVNDPTQYQADMLQIFLASLRNASSGGPVHQLIIASLTLTPSPLNILGGVDVLIPTNQVSVSVVVANTGTERENLLAVQASIAPSAGNAVIKTTISLPPGAAFNAQLGPLNPPPGAVVTLTATVTPPPGSPTPVATRTVTFQTTAPSPTTASTGGTGGIGGGTGGGTRGTGGGTGATTTINGG
ncbi:MAG: hypothetical protein M3137_02180 [Actinomycetota bacterium]|nr:hypothetical protein [Actinomycetota bacterium]